LSPLHRGGVMWGHHIAAISLLHLCLATKTAPGCHNKRDHLSRPPTPLPSQWRGRPERTQKATPTNSTTEPMARQTRQPSSVYKTRVFRESAVHQRQTTRAVQQHRQSLTSRSVRQQHRQSPTSRSVRQQHRQSPTSRSVRQQHRQSPTIQGVVVCDKPRSSCL
jgi:hypothetical protein